MAARTHQSAKSVSLVIGAAYGLVTVLGVLGLLKVPSVGNFGDPDNFLHLTTSALTLYFATAGAEPTAALP